MEHHNKFFTAYKSKARFLFPRFIFKNNTYGFAGVSRPGKIWLSKNYIILTCAHGLECFDGYTYQLRYSQHSHTSSGVSNLIFDEENDRLISVACAELFVSKLSTGEIILRLSEQDYKASPVQWERGAWQVRKNRPKNNIIFSLKR
jgi:hypothetical protein